MIKIKPTIGFVMGNTMFKIMKELNRGFAEAGLGINIEQFGLLNFINSNEDIIQQDIAGFMHKDKSAILRQIDVLEKMRIVIRLQDPDDRRKKNLVLTKKGVELLGKACEVEDLVMSKIQQGISPEEILAFKNTLFKILNNCD